MATGKSDIAFLSVILGLLVIVLIAVLKLVNVI